MIHEAFFYSSDEEFADGLVPFLADAVSAGQGAVAVTTEQRIELLRQGLGAQGDAVSFFDSTGWYRRPGATLLAWRDALDRQLREDGVEFVRAIGEVVFPQEDGGVQHWARYESLLTDGVSGRPAWIVCPYNTEALSADIVTAARRTHPIVSSPSGRGPSPSPFDHELPAVLAFAGDRPDAQERSCLSVSRPADVDRVRPSVRWQAQSAGLSSDVVDDLLLAITDLVRTALEGPASCATVRTARDGDEWFCEVRSDHDTGAPALRSQEDELGVVIGRVIGDRVEVAEGPDGSLVRIVFGSPRADPRQRILNAASELFRTSGVRSTGINAVIARAGVAKATFYSQVQSKDDLIRLWLRSPAARWFDHARAELEIRTESPAERLTDFFDVLGEWLSEDGFRGCPFIDTAAEFRGTDHESRRELAELSVEIQEYFRRTAADAGLADPDAVAAQLFLLVPGTITTASARGSAEPARAARAAAASLVASAERRS